MNYSKEVEKQRAISKDFTEQNFGLKLGSEYPSIATDFVNSNDFAMECILNTMLVIISSNTMKTSMEKYITSTTKDSAEFSQKLTQVLKENPHIYEPMLEYLYYGIQIGRQQEREQTQALSKLEASLKDPVPAFKDDAK